MSMPAHRPVQASTPLAESNQPEVNAGEAVLSGARVVEMIVERAPIRLQILKAVLNDANATGLTVPLDTPTIRGVQLLPAAATTPYATPINIRNNQPETTHAHDNRPFNPWGNSTIQQPQTLAPKETQQKSALQHEVKEATVSPPTAETTRISNNANTPADNLENNSIKSVQDHISPPRVKNESQVNQPLASDGVETKDGMNLTLQSHVMQRLGMSVEETTASIAPLTPEMKTTTSSADSASSSLQADPTARTQSSHSAHQHDTPHASRQKNEVESQQEQEYHTQRSDHIRLLQQIRGSLPSEQTPHSYTYPTQDSTTHDPMVSAQHVTLHPSAQALETTRASVFNSLSTLENQLRTVSPVVGIKASEPLPSVPHNVQCRQTLSTSNPTLQKQYDHIYIQRSDRSTPQRIENLIQNTTGSSAHTTLVGNTLSAPIQLAPHKVSSILSTSIPGLLASLRQFTDSTKNLSLLRSFDSPLENAFLTIATGIAVGLMGPALALRTSYRLATQLRSTLSNENIEDGKDLDSRDSSEIEEQKRLLDKLDDTLAEFAPLLSAQDISSAGLVADVAGIVFYTDSMTPAPCARITSIELGTCTTTEDGIFIFSNIPIGTSYTLSIQDPRNLTHWHTVQGACSEITYFRIGLS